MRLVFHAFVDLLLLTTTNSSSMMIPEVLMFDYERIAWMRQQIAEKKIQQEDEIMMALFRQRFIDACYQQMMKTMNDSSSSSSSSSDHHDYYYDHDHSSYDEIKDVLVSTFHVCWTAHKDLLIKIIQHEKNK
jgi:hypothetical protein